MSWVAVAEFRVVGTPKPAGSKRAFTNRATGRAMLVDASGQPGKDWRADVKAAAMGVYQGDLIDAPIYLCVEFRFSRPKSHYGTGRNAKVLKARAPEFHTKAPDTTKLLRGLEDALTGILWTDDSRVVVQRARKDYVDRFTEHPGAQVCVQKWAGLLEGA